MVDLNITIEEENLEKIVQELKGPEMIEIKPEEKVEENEDMDTYGDVLLKYKCDICNKRVTTSKGLKTHKSRMHEKSLQRLERERKQQYQCDECDIKRDTEVLLKSHKKLVHGNIKRNLSEMKRGSKTTHSPPSLSPPPKKVKENEDPTNEDINADIKEDINEDVHESTNEDELDARIERLRTSKAEIISIQKKEIDNLNNLLSASGEVITNLENENNNLNAKAEFYEEVAESLVTENESLLLKLQQIKEQDNQPSGKKVSFNPEPFINVSELEEGEGNAEDWETEEEEEKDVEDNTEQETGFRQQTGRVRCIVCGITRNTRSQMKKHMQIHKEDGEFVPAGQIHCALSAFPECPFQCSSNEELLKHIEIAHAKQKCNDCSETFDTKEGLQQHIKRTHSSEFWCTSCETRFETKNDLDQHIFNNHKSHKPCREFTKNNKCEYDTECRYNHTLLLQGEQICFKCGDKLKSQSLLMKHIKDTHSDIICKNFLENSCSYGTRCMFRHRGPPAHNVARQKQADFWEAPTGGHMNLTVGTQNQTVTKTEVMQMTQMMSQLMNQMTRLITTVSLQTQ